MGKGGAGASKTKKILFGLFAAIIIVSAGIVLLITYLPASLGEIEKSFNEILSTLSEEDGDFSKVGNFIDNCIQQMQENNSLSGAKVETMRYDYVVDDTGSGSGSSSGSSQGNLAVNYDNDIAKAQSFENIMDSVIKVSYFLSNKMTLTIEGKTSRKNVKAVQGGLSDVGKRIEKMAEKIEKYADVETNFSIIYNIWQSIVDDYQAILKDYVNAFKAIKDIYSNSKFKGVYGNEATKLCIKANYNYFDLAYKNLFVEKDGYSVANGRRISEDLESFSEVFYLNSAQSKIITDYYKNAILQKNIDGIKNLEYMTDKKVDFAYLIQNNFDFESLELTDNQKRFVNPSVSLLKVETQLLDEDMVLEPVENEEEADLGDDESESSNHPVKPGEGPTQEVM